MDRRLQWVGELMRAERRIARAIWVVCLAEQVCLFRQ
jgi:hypothetical protein